jgi:hypothetical protein
MLPRCWFKLTALQAKIFILNDSLYVIAYSDDWTILLGRYFSNSDHILARSAWVLSLPRTTNRSPPDGNYIQRVSIRLTGQIISSTTFSYIRLRGIRYRFRRNREIFCPIHCLIDPCWHGRKGIQNQHCESNTTDYIADRNQTQHQEEEEFELT